MNIALVHDWIISYGGAERVLEQLHAIWPSAPIYTLLHSPTISTALLPSADIRASYLQSLPRASSMPALLGPLMPTAIESFDLSGYDVVLSSSVLFSKGIVTRPSTRHFCYCYSPSRLLWDRHASYERSGMTSQILRHGFRIWDFEAAQRPDHMIAISSTVSSRIKKYYRRSSTVIPPPTRAAGPLDHSLVPNVPYYLIVARAVPHKQLQVMIDVFAKLRERLVIVGAGPLLAKLRRNAPDIVTCTGWISDAQLDALYEGCIAVLIANNEDWGLTAVEAMLRGKPVLALRRGGVVESVLEGVTGEFFDDTIPEAIADGVHRLTRSYGSYHRETIQSHAKQYDINHFQRRMVSLVTSQA